MSDFTATPPIHLYGAVLEHWCSFTLPFPGKPCMLTTLYLNEW